MFYESFKCLFQIVLCPFHLLLLTDVLPELLRFEDSHRLHLVEYWIVKLINFIPSIHVSEKHKLISVFDSLHLVSAGMRSQESLFVNIVSV